MNNELKKRTECNGLCPCCCGNKKEAIKHIKLIGNCGAENEGMYGEITCGKNGSCTKCNYKMEYLFPWIKDFFNINPEEINGNR